MKGNLILNHFLAASLPFSTQSCSMECLSIFECCYFDMSVSFHGVTVNGWMETNVFADWFDAFADENKGHPMLLLFNGHMTHISIHVIQ